MNLFKKLSLYWRLVEIDIKSEKTVRNRIGKTPGRFVSTSDKFQLTKIADDIKQKKDNFSDIEDSKYNIHL